MYKKRLYFYVIFSFWIILTLFSLAYNVINGFVDAKNWLPLSDSEKKYKLFGDMYVFFAFVKQHTPASTSILLYPHTEEIFYRGIYDLYPRVIYTAKDIHELKDTIKKKPTLYIATYDTSISLDGYEKIASFSGKKSTNFGILYKRK